jgi:hypothetical protein
VKRGVVDVLRRGFDNTFANWPLLFIRVAEMILFVALTVATVIAAVLPVLVSIGIHLQDISSPEDVANILPSLLTNWLLLIWILLAVSLLLLAFIAVHAFIEAGAAAVYVDGERAAGRELAPPRARYAVFSGEKWFSGARAGWWPVFWIYNVVWGFAALILLIPLLPTAIAMFLFRGTPAAMIGTGCIGIIITVMLAIVVGVLSGMWANRAIVEWGIRRRGGNEAVSAGWSAMKADFGRHLLVALAVIVVGMALSTVLGGLSLSLNFGNVSMRPFAILSMMMAPMRIALTLVSWVISAAVSGWYLASYASISLESRP